MKTLTARRLLTDVGVVEFAVVEVGEDGLIADINSDPRALAGNTDTLTAAFFDVHTHGAMGHDVMEASCDELGEMQRFLATRGVAQYLPTTVTAPVDATLKSLEALADAIESEPREGEARAVGIHLEGPFLSHLRRGVHPADLLQPPSVELFDRFQQAARGHIALVTIAPEPNAARPGQTPESALELIAHATAGGVRVSLGHTNATAAEAMAGVKAGAVSATHTFNAMRPLEHREPGVLGVVISNDAMWGELICDGVHVAPEVVKIWFRAKAAAKRILVTDAMSAAGMPDGDYWLAGLPVTVADGRAFLKDDMTAGKTTLAGSVLTMDRAVENLQAFAGATLGEAVACASDHPAAMLGRGELTRMSVGSLANLNRFDGKGRLVGTCVRGVEVRASRG
ncbi:MAG: N-acetylglucosamine-6-phosphate deacetylase [Acidobacteriota bacterium]